MSKNIVIAGGTGFIGKSLAHFLQSNGYHPILLARHQPQTALPFTFAAWDGTHLGDWVAHLNNAIAVINLAGKSVDCIKTPDNCDLILRSRVNATMAIAKALQQIAHPPKTWIQMSTAHIYGDPPVEKITENSAFGYGLAPFVGKAWEETLLNNLPVGMREVRLRTSFVIGKNGGALESLKRIVGLGLGGPVGHGKQGISWIHEADLNTFILQAIEQPKFAGPYILSAPEPVSNRSFMQQLRRAMRMPIGLPTPAGLARIGAHFIFKTDPELALFGRYVYPGRLLEEGFEFKFPNLEKALEDLIQR